MNGFLQLPFESTQDLAFHSSERNDVKLHFICPFLCLFCQVTAHVYDDANPENIASTNLTINVRRNENAPRFDRGEYAVNMLEIDPIGSEIVQLEASDRDNDELQFYIMDDTDARFRDYFYLNPFTGMVTLARPLSLSEERELTVTEQLLQSVMNTLRSSRSLELGLVLR